MFDAIVAGLGAGAATFAAGEDFEVEGQVIGGVTH